MSIRIAPDRTSFRTVLKCVVLTLLDSGGVALPQGTGGAGALGGLGGWRWSRSRSEAPGTFLCSVLSSSNLGRC